MLKKATSGGTTFTGGDISSALTPSSDNTLSVGTAAKRFANGHFTTVNSAAFTAPGTSAMVVTANVTDSGTNCAFTFSNTTALTGTTLLAKFGSNGSYKIHIEDDGSLAPVTDGGCSIGTAALRFADVRAVNLFGNNYLDLNGNAHMTVGASATNVYTGRIANGGSAVAHSFRNVNALSTSGAKIVDFHSGNGSSEKAFIDKDGQFENTTAGNGIILKSPDGTRYRLTIANGGTVSIAAA